MKISLRKANCGIAVIVALIAVTVLTLLAGAFAYSMKIETRLASNGNSDEQMLWLGRAGVERARWWLSFEGNQPYTSLDQYWNHGPGDGPETNSPLASESLDNFPVGPGTVSLSFTELESKININGADGPLLKRVLNAMNVDAGDLSVVSDSIQDWVDPDDATLAAGAESDYYLGLTPPYYAKNAPIDDLSELLLIKGVTPEMFNGSGRQNGPGTPFPQHKLGFGAGGGGDSTAPAFYLTDVFTPFSDGKINILTADENVLTLLFDNDSDLAQKIMQLRDINNTPPLRDVNQLVSAGANPQQIQQLSRYLGVRGDTYQVTVTARLGELQHQYVAVLFRIGPNVLVVSFHQTN